VKFSVEVTDMNGTVSKVAHPTFSTALAWFRQAVCNLEPNEHAYLQEECAVTNAVSTLRDVTTRFTYTHKTACADASGHTVTYDA
jgi:hypothetical protein